MQTITVPVKHLAAALHCAGKKDIRYYLNSVFLDAKAGCIVATDGTCAYISQPGLLVGCTEDVNMPREFVEDVVKASAKLEYVVITVDNGKLFTDFRIGKVVDGVFPPWRRLYPVALSGEPAQFDKDLLARIAKANKALGAKSGGSMYEMFYNGMSGAVAVLTMEQAHVVLMPFRPSLTTFTRFGV